MGGLLHLVQQGGAWEGCGRTQSPPRCAKCNIPCTHQRQVYQRSIIRCGTIITLALWGVYSDTTQLNSTDPVEQRTAKSVVFLFMTSRPTN